MNTHTNWIVGLCAAALVLLISACSKTHTGTSAGGTPQFWLARGDISSAGLTDASHRPELVTAHKTAVWFLHLSGSAANKLQDFTAGHLNQEVQIFIGTNLVSEPTITSVITNNELLLYYPDFKSAKIVEDALAKN